MKRKRAKDRKRERTTQIYLQQLKNLWEIYKEKTAQILENLKKKQPENCREFLLKKVNGEKEKFFQWIQRLEKGEGSSEETSRVLYFIYKNYMASNRSSTNVMALLRLHALSLERVASLSQEKFLSLLKDFSKAGSVVIKGKTSSAESILEGQSIQWKGDYPEKIDLAERMKKIFQEEGERQQSSFLADLEEGEKVLREWLTADNVLSALFWGNGLDREEGLLLKTRKDRKEKRVTQKIKKSIHDDLAGHVAMLEKSLTQQLALSKEEVIQKIQTTLRDLPIVVNQEFWDPWIACETLRPSEIEIFQKAYEAHIGDHSLSGILSLPDLYDLVAKKIPDLEVRRFKRMVKKLRDLELVCLHICNDPGGIDRRELGIEEGERLVYYLSWADSHNRANDGKSVAQLEKISVAIQYFLRAWKNHVEQFFQLVEEKLGESLLKHNEGKIL